MTTALQVKTSYSILSSLSDIKKLIIKAKELGYTSLAITDQNNMFGVMEFYLECKRNDIKPIIGIELSYEKSKLLLYAQNQQGYKNIIKLSTIISERDLTKEDLDYYKDNLILVMPFLFYDEEIYNLYEKAYIGYSTIEEREKIKEPSVFINNVSYIDKSDYIYLDYLIMIKDGKTLGEYELNTHKGKHLLTKEELSLFIDEETKQNMNDIISNCNLTLGYTADLLPIYDNNIDAFEYLSSLCNKGLRKRLNNNVNIKYQERLDYELEVIKEMGFCDYFLIVWDYVKYAKFNDILVGPGRGSAAGSLVSYTLGITDIDPIKYNLLFERFLNPERVTMPDIDIDFDGTKRNEVIDYVISKYGDKRVAGIIVFNTLGSKQVIRDVSRVLNIPLPQVEELAKSVLNHDLKESYNLSNKFKRLVNSSTELKKLYDIAIHLEGLPRHVSIHAAGIIMSRHDLDEIIPLYKNQLGIYTTAYSMNYLESLGLLKMDFLGLDNLTLIDNVIKDIREKEKINITFDKISLDDRKTLEIFKNVKTDGIFQFESVGIKRFLEKLKVNSFEDIVTALALYRPGPMDNIDNYIKRREGREKIDYIDNCLKQILEPTAGIIIYQEQIMQIVVTMAGYSYGEADVLRRAMSKKKESILIEERPKFIKRSIENGHTEMAANQVYDLILKFANFGFNRSHSVAYAIIAYKMAFLKTYFPTFFITGLLTNAIGNDLKTKTYLSEARQNDIKISSPNINVSTAKYMASKNEIRCPLSIIRNVGSVVSNDIIREREKGNFTDFIDFVKRMYSVGINKKVITSLINAGCFTDFSYNKKTLINNLDNIVNYCDIAKEAGMIEIAKPEIEVVEEYQPEELIINELSVYGFYLEEHPVNKYKKVNDLNSRDIEIHFDKLINIVLYVEKINETTTKNNDVMAFIKGADEYGNISLTLFPKIYSDYNWLKPGDIVRFSGRVEKRFDKYQLVVNSAIKLN